MTILATMPGKQKPARLKFFRATSAPAVVTAQVSLVFAALLLWELITRQGIIDEFWISKPSAIIPAAFAFLSSFQGWNAVAVTLYEALVGLLLALVFGVLTAFLITRSAFLHKVLNPFISVLNAVPRLALTPLFIVWFGLGSPSKIAIVFVICFFTIAVNTVSAIESVDRDLLTVARLLGASNHALGSKVIAPSSVPWLLAGLRVGGGNAFGGAVVAEMIAGQGGLGFTVSSAAALLNLRDVFVVVVIVMVIAYIFDVLLLKLERRLLRWRPEDHETT